MALDPRWEEIFRTRAWGKYPPEEFIRFMAAHYYRHPRRHEVRVFEAGFGTGANLWYAAREGFTVFGLEGSHAGHELTTARLDAEVPGWREHGARLEVGDITQPLPWPAESFDVVVESDAATCNSHEEARRLYDELHRVARPGGRLYVRTPAAGTWGEGTGTAHGRGQWECAEGPFANTGIVRFATEEDLVELLASWKVEQLEEVSRTMGNRAHVVREWVVSAVKA